MRNSRAFTLIEILLVVAIIVGVMAIFPRLMQQKPELEWTYMLDKCNDMLAFTRQTAASTGKNYRLAFVSQRRDRDQVVIQQEVADPERRYRKLYPTIERAVLNPVYELPKGIKVKAVYVDGKEQLSEGRTRTGAIMLAPDRLVSKVVVHLEREVGRGSRMASFVIDQPFIGRIRLENTLVSPRGL